MIRKSFVAGMVPAVLFLWLGVSGCRIAPVQPAGFVNPAVMYPSPADTAFRREFVSADYNPDRYKKIFIKPVVSTNSLKNNGLEDMNVRNALGLYRGDMKDFVDYTYVALRNAVPKNSNFKLADRPGDGTLNVELALVKTVVGKPVFHGFMLFLIFPIGPCIDAGVNLAADNAFTSQVAMECRITDASGKLVMGLADNEKSKAAIFNLLNFTAYGNQRQIVDEWAENVVKQLANIKGKSVPAPTLFVPINY